MDRRAFLDTLSLLAALPLAAQASPGRRVYRLGYLTVPSHESAHDGATEFSRGLRDLGWVEGENIVVEYRFAAGNLERLPEFATELVRMQVDVLVAGATPAVRAAKGATQTIPIVMFLPSDPVGSGLVASLARPGGNVTGLAASAGPEIYGKQLQLLKEAVPRVTRVTILIYRPNRALYQPGLKALKRAAHSLGVQWHVREVDGPGEFERAFAAPRSAGSEAMLVPADSLFYQHRARLSDLAAKSRIPTMWGLKDHAEAGGLMAYSPSLTALSRGAARYVDKILKGAKPADLPVEQPTKFELVINLKTAKALGLTISPLLLQRADQVIE